MQKYFLLCVERIKMEKLHIYLSLLGNVLLRSFQLDFPPGKS